MIGVVEGGEEGVGVWWWVDVGAERASVGRWDAMSACGGVDGGKGGVEDGVHFFFTGLAV